MISLAPLLLLSNLALAQLSKDTSLFYQLSNFNLAVDKIELDFRKIETYDYKFAGDIFNLALNLFSNELGENGKPLNLNFNLVDMRSSNFFINFRSLNGYIYPYQLFNTLPLDNICKIEILRNYSSSLFQNSNSSSVNFAFKNAFTYKPITRIRYIEDAYDFIATDGSFSHNFYRNLNLTLGFRRSTSAGRFSNSQHDGWNFFLNYLWIPFKNLKLSLLNIYTIWETALNGGVDTSKIESHLDDVIYNEKLTKVVDERGKLKLNRNDLTALSILQIDSSNTIRFVAYHTVQIDRVTSQKDPNRKISNLYGLNLNLKTFLLFADIDAGMEIQKNNMKIALLNDTLATGYISSGSKSLLSFSVFFNSRFKFNNLNISPFVRLENIYGKAILNYGFGSETKFGNLNLCAGFSSSRRIPTLLEQFITKDSEFEKHQVYEVSIRTKTSSFSFDYRLQNRKIWNFLVFYDSTFYRTNVSRIHSEVNISFRFWRFYFSMNSSMVHNKISKPYPKYFSKAEIFYEGNLTRTLFIRSGVRAKVSDKFNSFRFVNSALLFVESKYEIKEFTTIDFFANARVKNAVIFIVLSNIANTKYMTTAFYPMQGRSLRLGVIWTFFD